MNSYKVVSDLVKRMTKLLFYLFIFYKKENLAIISRRKIKDINKILFNFKCFRFI
jgi:hypothetical protein